MRTKGVFLLGLVLCWTAVCYGEDGSDEFFGLDDALSKELRADNLIRVLRQADETPGEDDDTPGQDDETPEEVICKEDADCTDAKKICKINDDDEKLNTCGCADGLSGDECQTLDWCENGKYKDCKEELGKCGYNETTRTVECTCASGKKLHPEENKCRDCDCGTKGTCDFDTDDIKCDCQPGYVEKDKKCTACKENKDCGENKKCKINEEDENESICVCADGLSGDNCQTNDWCSDTGKFKNCNGDNGTCEYDVGKRSVVCTCATGKELHPLEKRCRETCTDNSECQYGGSCKEEEEGGQKFCKCLLGFIGDKCETVFDCTSDGKFKGCSGAETTCSYDMNTKTTICKCPGDQKYHDTENICKDCDCGPDAICSFKDGQQICDCKQGFAKKDGVCTATCAQHEDCNDYQKCVEKDGWKSCVCADGLSGDKCEIKDWCELNGKFKNCNGYYGRCDYDKEKRSVDCICPDGKVLHPKENICRVTCNDGDCEHGTECKSFDTLKFCNCTKGLSGDKCATVVDCDVNGKFKDCKDDKGSCFYDETKKAADCECDEGKKLDAELNYCLDCACGENEECSISNNVTSCACIKGFARNGENCEECSCGDKGTCSFENGKKKCICQAKHAEDADGICKECDCGDNGKCDFKDGNKNCTCKPTYVVKEKDKKCYKCDCGSEGTCSFNEQDKPECNCKEGYQVYQGKCKECNCGPNGDCKFSNNGQPQCECHEGYTGRKDGTKTTCVETCGGDDECEHKMKCQGPEGKKYCRCNNELGGDKCEIIKACDKKGLYEKCDESGGECKYDTTQSKATCTCTGSYLLDPDLHYCREKCSAENPCSNGGECVKGLCKCQPGTTGDYCNDVTACKTLNCEDKDAVCKYDHTKTENTFCECSDEKFLFVKEKSKCVEKCNNNGDCQNGGTCNEVCVCKPGTSGDKCETVDCGDLKCEAINAQCKFDVANSKPTCECNDKNYYYENKKCLAQWCKDGCNLIVSTCEYNDGVGVCKCKTNGTYYNYDSAKCEAIDKCFEVECKENEICRKGKCECQENYKKKDDKCEKMDLCDKENNKCFAGARCEAGIELGFVKCPCDSDSKFYLPSSNKCDDGSCFLTGFRSNCTGSCPSGLKREGGECKHIKAEKACDKDCGFLGWCLKVSDKLEKCVCDPKYAEIKNDTCVLKAAAVCPTKEKDGDNKCKCTGKYKLSGNEITCELKSCSDEDVQNECKGKGAICIETWKGKNPGYKCVCPTGYVEDSKKGCIDPCSQDEMKDLCSSRGQVCYVGSKLKEGDCRCPPTFTYDERKQSCDLSGANTYMIHKLPVLSKNYETADKNINKVLLNIDVSNSMKQAFKNLDFVHVFSFKVENDVLLCDIWLQFKPQLPSTFNATLEVQRWRAHKVEVKNQLLLPPALLLSESGLNEASEEQLTLCTASVRQTVCGRGSTCDDKKGCSCDAGYRVIDSTIKSYGDARILRCEDIDECAESTHSCSDHSKCENTAGGYFCKCDAGYRKENGDANAMNREKCVGLCELKPCNKGTCQVTKEFEVDCTCEPGYSGSFCNKKDVNLAKASKATKVVGAVLGTILAIVIVLIIVYVIRQRKNSYSEDFTPAPRVDNAEMSERRPMRGVTNRAFQ